MIRMSPNRSTGRREGSLASRPRKAVAIIELALVLPILTLLILGILDWGFILVNTQHMIHAVRNGARIRSSQRSVLAGTAAQQSVEAYLASVSPSIASNVTVTVSDPDAATAWVRAEISFTAASVTGSTLVVPSGNLATELELDYLTAVP